MPEKLERELKIKARVLLRIGKLKRRSNETPQEAIDRYVYGTLRKTGWKPKGK